MGQDRHMQPLGPVDSAFYYLDNPLTPMNIGGIMIVEGQFDFDKLVELVDARLHMAPLYQQRVINTPMNMGEPTWVFDSDFFIRNHVFRLQLDPPGQEEQLRALCGRLVGSMLDRDKPLWELYVIEGLQGNRTAILFKVHHCMVDGLSAVELFTLMLDFTPDEPKIPAKPLYNPPKTPGNMGLLRQAASQALPHRWKLLRKLGTDAVDIGMNFLDRDKRKRTLMGLVSVINDNLSPIRRLGINGQNTGNIQVAWTEFQLADIKAIRKARGVSVNDVMLTILGTGIDRYLRQHGGTNEQPFVRVIIPVNMREPNREEDFGNRISLLPIEVPLEELPVLERLEAVRDYTRLMKEAELADSFDMALTLPSLLPAVGQPLVWSVVPRVFSLLAHTWCTNVPGPQLPLYLLGNKLQSIYGFFPLNPSMGLACVILSYNQKITMNLIADAGIVEDPVGLRNHLNAALDDLRKASGVKPSQPIVIEPDPPAKTPSIEESAAEIVAAAEAKQAQKAQDAQNGTRSAPPVDATDMADTTPPQPVAPTSGGNGQKHEKPKLMSEEWAQALHAAINTSRDYYDASKRWTAGSIGMVMHASPANGFNEDSAVWLDLYRGKSRAARSLSIQEVKQVADFVLEASYENWMDVLSGREKALPMIMRGKLRLSKGAMRKLLPYTKSAEELVNCAMSVS